MKVAKWIWLNNEKKDQYGEFYSEFNSSMKSAVCRLSCDGDYTLFINGQYVASNQYGDFEHYKVYDEVDITSYLQEGENRIAILVWHFGENSQRYINKQAGVIFEIEQDGKILLASDEKILCRESKAYLNGYGKKITDQLGLSFLYDATKEDDWKIGHLQGFSNSILVAKSCIFNKRPTIKLQVQSKKDITILKNEGNYYLIDLGEETVGLPFLEFNSTSEQKILVAWGEDLQNGHVRRLIWNRDFSFEYIAKIGANDYTNYMLRLGCRYLEVYAEHPIKLHYAGLLPQVYPIQEKKVHISNVLDASIYNMCLRTLELSMMEHYVDTPWREQCLYVFDSRNQMLCGYSAFENGNAEYARANLLLMSKDIRDDGLLSICYPCGMDLTIPSFSLYYFMAVKEYIEHTKDVSLGEEVYPKLLSIIRVFFKNMKEGLVCAFAGANHWNFYDWSPYLDGALHGTEDAVPDLMINVLFILALQNLREIALKIDKSFAYGDLLGESKKRTQEAFYNAETGLYSMTVGGSEYTVLGNALVILAGLDMDKEYVCEKIVNDELCDCSLSMKIFKYDALLATDKEKYQEWVLNEIRREYGKMLESGNTVWETIDGASAFEDAGSLCHGWSAIPVYYYTKLKNV